MHQWEAQTSQIYGCMAGTLPPVPQQPNQPNIAFPFKDLFLFMCQDVSVYLFNVYESGCGGQKRPLDPQELELYMVVSHPV